MQLFIDESGNLGKDGSCFVICCLAPQNTKRLKNIVKKRCVDFGESAPLKEIKAYTLNLPQKQLLLNDILRKDDCSFSYIVAEKCHLEPRILCDKNICYNYLVQHLLKPVIKGASEDVEVVLDNHSIKVSSLNSLADYIRIEAYTKWGFMHDISFTYMDSHNCKTLQIADFLSNTVYGNYERKSNHLYAQITPLIRHSIKFPQAKFSLGWGF